MPQGNYLFDIQFINAQKGWIIGQGGTLMRTTDGGNTWDYRNLQEMTWIYSLHFLNENTGYIAGTNGKIMKTVDSGEH